jgi:hypothetical protein
MVTILIQLPMLGQTDPNSLTPTRESASGGKSNSTKTTSLTESESLTEETAAVEDLLEPKSLLTKSFADKFKEAQEMANGMKSNVKMQSLVRKSELSQPKTLT